MKAQKTLIIRRKKKKTKNNLKKNIQNACRFQKSDYLCTRNQETTDKH